jgi:hypothetical protein
MLTVVVLVDQGDPIMYQGPKQAEQWLVGSALDNAFQLGPSKVLEDRCTCERERRTWCIVAKGTHEGDTIAYLYHV